MAVSSIQIHSLAWIVGREDMEDIKFRAHMIYARNVSISSVFTLTDAS
jgi:hypothetical protein